MAHSSHKFDWDDLRHLLAVARHGSTLAAGRALGVDQSTVQRRLAELERRLGQSLVQRQPTGYRLTEPGQELLPYAETVEQSALLDRFHARHPVLKVQFVMSDKYLDLAKGGADVALRSGDTEDGALVGRKIADSIWAVYASQAYIERHGRPQRIQDLAGHALVGFDETMARHRTARWLHKVAPDAALAARCNSVLGLVYSVKAGIGVGPLPIALGDAEPDLVRVIEPVAELTRIWRLLTTPELRRTPRVRGFFDFIVEEIDSLKPILTG